jgi:outer membrane usher protein
MGPSVDRWRHRSIFCSILYCVMASLLCPEKADAAAPAADDLASHFRTAPEAPPTHQALVQIIVNGVDSGILPVTVSGEKISLPPATATALRIRNPSGAALDLASRPDIASKFDEAQSVLKLTVAIPALVPAHFGGSGTEDIQLSPETWGAYTNYDVNIRRALAQTTGLTAGQTGGIAWGGLFDLNGLGPDLVGHSAWAYDTQRTPESLVRLDSNLTWRPASLSLAATAGDLVSSTQLALPEARAYRFGGIQVGTDFGGTPSWSSLPIPSMAGTAQAQSSIDLYINGQRQFGTKTSGGAFSLILPPGASGSATSIVVTDVTGRTVILPVQVPRLDQSLLRSGLFLWSAGAGAARFGYGSQSFNYLDRAYGFVNGRYGVSDELTVNLHSDSGPGLVELEGGVDLAAFPWLITHASVAGSRSGRGSGASGGAGLSALAPWDLTFDGTVTGTLSHFDDVVSVSGRAVDVRLNTNPLSTLPAKATVSGRVSWQPSSTFSLSGSFQKSYFQGSVPVGLVSVTASYSVLGLPTFLTVSHNLGGQSSSSILAGISITLGDVQGSASAGYGAGLGTASGLNGGVTLSQPLRESPGDIEWQVNAQRQPGSTYVDADASIRTGYGIPGVEVNSFGGQTTGYLRGRGSVGFIEWHPFVSDPVDGGLILADGGAPGIPVQLNGYDKGRTSFDGKLVIPNAVPGVPQRVAIDTSRLPLDMIPSDTDQAAVVRNGGASVVKFGTQSASSSAIVLVTVGGKPPPIGSTLVASTSSAPLDRRGRAYLPSLEKDEILTVEFLDGGSCRVQTKFDGEGSVTRLIGPYPCVQAQP